MEPDYTRFDDGDTSTCYNVPNSDPTIRHPTPAWLAATNVTMTLEVLIPSLPDCSVQLDDVIAYVHAGVYLKGMSGSFLACSQTSMATSDGVHYVMTFECHCSYGMCEYVFTSVRGNVADSSTASCVSICEVEFAETF